MEAQRLATRVKGQVMERLIDVFTKYGHRHVWTYAIVLGGLDFHPSLTDFEHEAIRRAVDDQKGQKRELTAKVRHT
jgi:hypothetical protein